MTHSPKITHIDTVRAYHSGPRMIVEVDVVMDPEESLQATHDVAEELQSKLESLPDVERAYVHVDYETSHKPVSFLNRFYRYDTPTSNSPPPSPLGMAVQKCSRW